MEDPLDLSQHHLCDDGEICKTTSGFTTFPLNQSVESVIPMKEHILSPCLSNNLRLGKGAYLFDDLDGHLLKKSHNGLYPKRSYS